MSNVRRRRAHVPKLQASSLLRHRGACSSRSVCRCRPLVYQCARPGCMGEGRTLCHPPGGHHQHHRVLPSLAESSKAIPNSRASFCLQFRCCTRPNHCGWSRRGSFSIDSDQCNQLRKSSSSNQSRTENLPKLVFAFNKSPIVQLGAASKSTPNPSIERTSPGKPGLASHVKR
jgi:hypothetical protein